MAIQHSRWPCPALHPVVGLSGCCGQCTRRLPPPLQQVGCSPRAPSALRRCWRRSGCGATRQRPRPTCLRSTAGARSPG